MYVYVYGGGGNNVKPLKLPSRQAEVGSLS